MNGIQANNALAKAYLEKALANNQFEHYIFSMPLYDLKVSDGQGNMVHSAKHVMTAIYDKQAEEPTKNFGNLINQTVAEALKKYQYHPCIINLLENIEYHVQANNNQIANINIDTINLLDNIKEHLEKNQEIYKQTTQKHGNLGLWPQIELFNTRMQQTTGRKII